MDDDHSNRLEALFRCYRKDVIAYAWRCGAGRDEIEDVVAEVYFVAWKKITKIPDPPADRLWLLGVTRNIAARSRSSGLKRIRLFESLVSRTRSDTNSVVESESEMVREAVWNLPARERDAVIAVKWQGLTHEEAAQVLGCTPNATRLRVHRAKRRLREALSREDESPASSLT